MSLSLIGNENLSIVLRILTSIELYDNSKYYANHPYLNKTSNDPKSLFSSHNTPFAVSLSFDGGKDYDPDLDNKCNCVKKEAILMSCIGTWSSFMCMLGLSNVLKTTMISLYPKGGNHAIEQMMNCTITPTEKSDLEKIVIMWTRGGALNKSGPFDPQSFCSSAAFNTDGNI